MLETTNNSKNGLATYPAYLGKTKLNSSNSAFLLNLYGEMMKGGH
jgi:hypothetical protein